MPELPVQRIADLRREPGELSFEARLAGEEPCRLWIRSSTECEPNADAALALSLMPAMRHGGGLEMEEPVSPRVLRNQREFQAIQSLWSYDWPFGTPPLKQVEVEAPARPVEPRPPTGRVACFFSGGVDSFSAILRDPDVTDLIFVRGIDILPRLAHQEGLADRVEAKLREAAAELGLPLHSVEINARDLSDRLVPWEAYAASPLVAIALFFEPLFDRVLIPGDADYEAQPPINSARLVDQLWSTENLEVVDEGGRFGREEKVAYIADHPVVQRTLRVCWENPEGAYNCGRCRKCVHAMLSLEVLGVREQMTTFPPELDLDLLADYEMSQMIQLVFWEDLLDSVREHGRGDLERVVAPLVARGKRSLGLPPSYRVRRSSGVPAKRGWFAQLRQTVAPWRARTSSAQ